MEKLGLYIHIPFCIKRCNYCDFLSYSGISPEVQNAYIDALLSEIRHYSCDEVMIDSVYIGGGTPSHVDGYFIVRIMEMINTCFKVLEDAEITIEANPESLREEKLKIYKEAGINRLSIGAQSMDDGLLKLMGRPHDAKTFTYAYQMSRACGFENISVDLIYALPGQTLKQWKDDLVDIVGLSPEHMSLYCLQIEEGTHFHDLQNKGMIEATADEEDRRMYHEAIEKLKEGGYRHYEISNWAKPGFESLHNLKYWSMKDYLGLGLGSHSYIFGARFSNETELDKYIRASKSDTVKRSLEEGSPWTVILHNNDRKDEMGEYLFTGLRKVEGILIEDFNKRFNVSILKHYKEQIYTHEKAGCLEFDSQFKHMRLTLKGMDLFNRVLVDFI
jgi:oxygen-independent coproporphyrinogen-3 oxidase